MERAQVRALERKIERLISDHLEQRGHAVYDAGGDKFVDAEVSVTALSESLAESLKDG